MRFACVLLAMTALAVTAGFAQPDTLWMRTFGGVGDEYASSITIAQNGDLFLLGSSNSFVGRTEAYLLRLNPNGDSLTSARYGIAGSGERWGVAAAEKSNGELRVVTNNFFNGTLTGYTLFLTHDYIDSDAGLFAGGMHVRESSTIIIGSRWITQDRHDGFLHRYFTVGMMEREYHVGYSTDLNAIADAGSGYLMVGSARARSDLADDFFLMHTDSLGDTLWTRTIGSTAGPDILTSVAATAHGSFVFCGPTTFLHPDGDFFLGCIRADGTFLWDTLVGGPSEDHAHKVVLMPDGGFLVVGHTDSYGEGGDIMIFRADSMGRQEWLWTGGGTGFDVAEAVVVLDDGGFVIAGTTTSYGAGSTDMFAMRFAPEEQATDPTTPAPRQFELARNYPNPFNSQTRIAFSLSTERPVSLRMFDVAGREVARIADHQPMNAGAHEMVWDAGLLPSGIYFCRLETGAMTQTRKMVLIR